MYLFDLYPTLCEMIGVPIPHSLEGQSFAPVLEGKADSVRDSILLGYKDCQRVVRHGQWKLIRYPKVDVTQIFDLKNDLHETKNLSEKSDQANRIIELMSLMRKEQERFGDTLPLEVAQPKKAEVDLDYFHSPKAKFYKMLWSLVSKH